MPIAKIELPDGRVAKFEVPEGTTAEQVTAFASQQFKTQSAAPAVPKTEMGLGDKIGSAIYDARKAVEGVPYLGRVAHAVFDIPHGATQLVAHGVNAVAPNIVSDADLKAYENASTDLEKRYQANRVKNAGGNISGLVTGQQPDPGFDWARLGVNAAMTAPAMAVKAATLPAMVGKNAAAGGAMGLVSPVENGNEDYASKKAMQVGSNALLGGLAPLVINPIVKGASSAINTAANKLSSLYKNAQGNLQVEAQNTIVNALAQNGVDLSKVPESARADLMNEVMAALKSGGKLDADALRRKADFLAIGAKPTLGQITRDPVQFTREQTLKGVQGAGEKLAETLNSNNRALVNTLNRSGATAAPGELNTGNALLDTINSYASGKQGEINKLYGAAKDSTGRAAGLDPSYFANTANDLLDQNLKGAFVPGEIRKMLNDFASGNVPLNVNSAEQFKTILASAQRGTQDGNVKAALGHVREALDNTPLLNGKNLIGESGAPAIDAFNKARAANRAFMGQIESTPALKAAIDGAQPDKFFQKYVLGSTVSDLQSTLGLLKDNPAAVAQVRAQVLDHLKSKALNGASDEVGNFSQSAFNKAINQIGDAKLSALFSPVEVQQLKTLGRVASYMQVQPAGSAVNNSNTASQGFNLLLKLAEKVPGGKAFVADPLNSAVNGAVAKNSLSARIPVTRDAVVDPEAQNRLVRLLLPLTTTAGAQLINN